MIEMRQWRRRSVRALMILVVSTRVKWRWPSCRRLPMDQYVNCGTTLNQREGEPGNCPPQKKFQKHVYFVDKTTITIILPPPKKISAGCSSAVAPLYPKFAISQTTPSQRSINNEHQYKVKQDFIQISKKNSNDILVMEMCFVTKE